jgi:hypothetical protein
MGHHVPCRARSHNPAQAIKDLAQAVLALRGIFGHEGQVGSHKGPFVIANITGVRFSVHTSSVTTTMQSA